MSSIFCSSPTGARFVYLVCCTSSSGIKGLGGGGINSMAMIIMSDVVSLQERGKYQGFIGAAVALGSGIGPLVGGALSSLWWMLPQNKMSANFGEKLRMIDFTGSVVSLAAVVLILVPLSGGGTYYSWNSALVISMISVGSALAVLFVLVEWRLASLPILPLYLFRNRNIVIIYSTTFLTGIVYYCNLYFLPSYYTDARGFTPVQAGIYLLPLVLIQSLSSSISGQLLSRTRYPKPIVAVGFSIWCIGAGLQSMFGLNTSKGAMVVYLIIEGAGIGMTLQSTLVAAQASALPKERAVITGSRNFFRTLGGAIGLVVCTTTKNEVLKTELHKIQDLSSTAVASIIKFGPQALTDSGLESAVRHADMSSLHAVFILFFPIAGISAIMSLCLRSVYLQGDKDVLPTAKTPTPPSSQHNLELSNMGQTHAVGDSVVQSNAGVEKRGGSGIESKES
ncbi:major facilitator superfamily transporter [Ceratobasidium sp. AG-Ba]|nr:major facilitator superfamily transporter [Ceratobasidium sp. AG-Ba]